MAIPTYVQNLMTRRDAVAAELAAMTSTAPGGKPNVSGEGGGTDHVGYKKSLIEELRDLNEQIKLGLEVAAAEEAMAGDQFFTIETLVD